MKFENKTLNIQLLNSSKSCSPVFMLLVILLAIVGCEKTTRKSNFDMWPMALSGGNIESSATTSGSGSETQTATEAIAADKAALAIGYRGSDSAESVTQNVILPTTGSSGTTITWASVNTGVIAIDGTVTRPSFSNGDVAVTVTATITKSGGTADTKLFNLTVIKAPPTATEAIVVDKAALAIGYSGSDSASSVTQNVTLPTIGSSGTTIIWSSTNTGVIGIDGRVTRPNFSIGNVTVTVTATITKSGGTTDLKLFILTVIKAPQTATEAIAEDKSALVIPYGGSDSAGSVTQNITLPTTGSSGTTITWTSTNTGVIGIDGTVTRPNFSTGDMVVTLIATITKPDGTTDTKVFNLTVTKAPQTATEAIAADRAALAISYIGSDSAGGITQNVILPTTGSSGTTITWASSNTGVIGIDGTVTRPNYSGSDTAVTLTATITKADGTTVTKIFNLTVIKTPQTAAEAIAADKAALAIIYGGSDSASSVTQNVILSTTGLSGTTITWASTNTGVIGIDGTVTRPNYLGSNTPIALTATITKAGGTTVTKLFNLTVIKAPQTATEAIAADKAALVIPYGGSDSAGGVTQNVTLPTTGSSGTTITWASTNPGVIGIDGTVTRPNYLGSDTPVTLTATITKADGTTDTKVFNLTVIKAPQTATEAIAADKAALVIPYGGSDSAGSVTQNVTLPTTGSSGTTITWASTIPGVIAIDGTVNRPNYLGSDTPVTLTATITKADGTTDTKVFNLTVIKAPQTATEAIAADKAALVIPYGGSDSAGSVTQNITLPTTGSSGTTITWASTNPGVIGIDGTVTRPNYLGSDTPVTLTATITRPGGTTETKVFNLTVIKAPQTATEAIAADKAVLAIPYGGSDSAGSVTQNVTLPTTGSSGTTITWASDSTGVISPDGTVTRPVGADATVVLTATISKSGGTSDTKTFTLTVKAKYTIGGSITGLTASGLVLRNNAGNNLTVANGATTFTFSTTVLANATYAVTVQTQPTGLTCTVSSGTGTVASANVANVAVSCLPNVATSTFSPTAGHYNTTQNISISTTTSGASLYYTTNGTTPTTSSTLYSTAIHIWSLAGKTVKALATKSGMANSAIATLSGFFSYPPLQSGQTTVHAAGDNGTNQTGVARSYTGPTQHGTYTSDYTTTDNATGLVWKTCTQGLSGATCATGAAVTLTWVNASADATNGCNALNSANSGNGYAGIKTWRLPTRHELETLPDYGKATSPAINTVAFPATVATTYWSSTIYAPDTSRASGVLFDMGSLGSSYPNNNNFYVRCVSGPSKEYNSNFTNNSDGTVKDNATGLIWQKCSQGLGATDCSGTATTVTWANAITYCNGLSLAGKTWRLPHINELKTLVDTTKATSPAINTTAFPATGDNHWSSTSYAPNPPFLAWHVYFYNGAVNISNKTTTYYVRCVSGP